VFESKKNNSKVASGSEVSPNGNEKLSPVPNEIKYRPE